MRAAHDLGILETLVLGRAYLGCSLMASDLKGRDKISLKIDCSGPVQGLVVEGNAFGEVRGYLVRVPIPLEKPLEDTDLSSCRCTVYRIRTMVNPRCAALSPARIRQLTWLPSTCAYRLLSEGKDLPPWHPLVSGDPGTVHDAGVSVRGRAVSGSYVHPDEGL
ncbi:MAG: Hsp33 family molecular chaperone HslO [Deltaproteobacteria bacterium]|nr:Hsp33 family molecular chaperone HslO [Deltaproteobacteria bacterium]